MALIVDTGPLVSLLDATDPEHARCAELLQGTSEPRVVPVCVLVEVEYLLRPWPEAFKALLAEFAAGGFELLELPVSWLLRAGELLEQYRDLPLGLAAASVVVATEMLNEPKLATLDHRHFAVVRPAHVSALTLLPLTRSRLHLSAPVKSRDDRLHPCPRHRTRDARRRGARRALPRGRARRLR